MPEARKCHVCGAELPSDSPDGECRQCRALGVNPPNESAPVPEPDAAPPTGTVIVANLSERPGDRIGRYKLLQEIGAGGMGTVWMAEQTEPVRRRVALKLIKQGMDWGQVLARFEAERQALALMDHPNIAKIFDAGVTGDAQSQIDQKSQIPTGRPYFVMELVKGIPLTKFCDEQRLSIRERLELFVPVCQAIQHAHQKGVIHRDISPSNVLVALYDGQPVPKVIDFGIAKAIGQSLTARTLFTEFGAIIGKLEYMSPEQSEMNQLDIDTRSDIYSLGVLLYELLTGTTPLTHEALRQFAFDETLRRIREQEPPKPSTRLVETKERLATISAQRKLDSAHLTKLLRGDLDWIAMKCLEKDRRRRYETANGLAMDVKRHLSGDPVIAGPPTAAYRLQKIVRKHKAVVSVALAFLLLLTSATAVSLAFGVAARRARKGAEQNAEVAAKASAEAQAQQKRSAETLIDMKLQRAEDFFAADDSARGVAYLANVVTTDPSNRVAVSRLLSALAFHDFRLPFKELVGHGRSVTGVRFSPDGLRLATASEDKTALVWDAETGARVCGPLRHEGPLLSLDFSPDGLRLATASEDKTALLWHAETGARVCGPLRHEGPVLSVHFSQDGRRLITASEDRTARIWDAQTGELLMPPLRHAEMVSSARFSPDGLWVVTASRDSTAIVWDSRTGRALSKPLAHGLWVAAAEFSPSGLGVATASWDKTARVWDAITGKHTTPPLRHDLWVMSARFSPDGGRLVTASFDKTARVWDAKTGQPLTMPLRHRERLRSAEFSPDGLEVLSVSLSGARLWDAKSGEPLTELLQHAGRLQSAQFSPDGLRVATGSSDKTARIWYLKSGKPLSPPLAHNRAIRYAEFSPDGSRAATASDDSTARVWDAVTGRPLTGALRHGNWVYSVKFSPDGLRVVTASEDRTAQVWHAKTGEPLTPPLRHKGAVRSASFSPDGLRVVTASDDHTAQMWEAKTGKPLGVPLVHGGPVRSADFSPEGLRVITASDDFTARVWDANTGEAVTKPLSHEHWVLSAQFSPDGRRVVTASEDGTAQVWDAITGKPTTPPLRHDGVVNLAQFSSDGRWVCTASSDNTARVWDSWTGEPLAEPLRHEGTVQGVQFSPDCRVVLTASEDHTARVWDAMTGKPLSEPLRHRAEVWNAHFSPDGLRVVTASFDRTARLWEMAFGAGPAPSWLPRFAEAAAGERLTPTAVIEPVPAEEFKSVSGQLIENPPTNYYTHWAKWFCADRSNRTVSPLSHVTVSEYVEAAFEADTVQSLREAARLSPASELAFKRLAQKLLQLDSPLDSPHVAEVQWCSYQMIRLNPKNPANWYFRGQLLERANRLEEAAAAYTTTIEMAPSESLEFQPIRTGALLSRSRVRGQMKRFDEARADVLLAKGIAPRDAQAPGNLIDLSLYYNAGLSETWHQGIGKSDLSALSQGIQMLAGVAFDLRGLIQVGGSSRTALYTNVVAGIAVERACQRLHFLHAAINAGGLTNGTEIGRYVVHHQNGQTNVIALIIGQQMAHWRKQTNESSNLVPAWMQSEESAAKDQKRPARLFKMTWENPLPELAIKSIDFICTHTNAAPFLVAITAEP